MQDLIKLGLHLYIETKQRTTQANAVGCAIQTITRKFREPDGITAKEAVVHLLESTSMIPGVFNIQMLSWRSKLQDLIHDPDQFLGCNSLQYKLQRSRLDTLGLPTTRTVAVQTKITNPNADHILEFVSKDYDLQWVLSSQ